MLSRSGWELEHTDVYQGCWINDSPHSLGLHHSAEKYMSSLVKLPNTHLGFNILTNCRSQRTLQKQGRRRDRHGKAEAITFSSFWPPSCHSFSPHCNPTSSSCTCPNLSLMSLLPYPSILESLNTSTTTGDATYSVCEYECCSHMYRWPWIHTTISTVVGTP